MFEPYWVKSTKDLKWAVYKSGRYWALVFTVSTEIENINIRSVNFRVKFFEISDHGLKLQFYYIDN